MLSLGEVVGVQGDFRATRIANYHLNSAGVWVPSGNTNPVPSLLTAGTAIAGKVGIDQTTPGTTNAVNPVTSAGAQVVGATDVAAPAGAIQLGGTDGTNLRALRAGYGGSGNASVGMLNTLPVLRRGSDGLVSTMIPAVSAVDGDAGQSFGVQGSLLWNNTSFDRQRGNTQGTLLASAARTVLAQTAEQTNYNGRAIALFLRVSANPGGAETLRFGVEIKDPESGVWGGIGDATISAATNNMWVLVFDAGATETFTSSFLFAQGIPVFRTWRAFVDPSGAGSWTYSLGFAIVV